MYKTWIKPGLPGIPVYTPWLSGNPMYKTWIKPGLPGIPVYTPWLSGNPMYKTWIKPGLPNITYVCQTQPKNGKKIDLSLLRI